MFLSISCKNREFNTSGMKSSDGSSPNAEFATAGITSRDLSKPFFDFTGAGGQPTCVKSDCVQNKCINAKGQNLSACVVAECRVSLAGNETHCMETVSYRQSSSKPAYRGQVQVNFAEAGITPKILPQVYFDFHTSNGPVCAESVCVQNVCASYRGQDLGVCITDRCRIPFESQPKDCAETNSYFSQKRPVKKENVSVNFINAGMVPSDFETPYFDFISPGSKSICLDSVCVRTVCEKHKDPSKLKSCAEERCQTNASSRSNYCSQSR
jgi:hypothetical protein